MDDFEDCDYEWCAPCLLSGNFFVAFLGDMVGYGDSCCFIFERMRILK